MPNNPIEPRGHRPDSLMDGPTTTFMLTPAQEKWVAHLSDDKKVAVVPFDPACAGIFESVRAEVADRLDPDMWLLHRGASGLGISGQDEIDAYLPVAPEKFDGTVNSVKTLYGEPRSLYPAERARFVTFRKGKHVDVFVINEECEGWKNAVRFENFLRAHPTALDDYRKMKEEAAGQSVREYYRRKIEFINQILVEARLAEPRGQEKA